MRFLRDFVTKMLIVQVVGVAGMLLAGWILTIIQRDTYCPQQNFFTYQIEHLDRVPAWFVFVLLQMAVNGFWMFKLAVLQGGVNTPIGGPYGNWGVEVPINYLRVFAVNLVVIPASLFLFMLIRHVNW
jgi:hypothetical protein